MLDVYLFPVPCTSLLGGADQVVLSKVCMRLGRVDAAAGSPPDSYHEGRLVKLDLISKDLSGE